jgi:hypothetical protein
MNNHARAAFDHGRQKSTAQADGGEQVLVDGLLPKFVRDAGKATVGSG